MESFSLLKYWRASSSTTTTTSVAVDGGGASSTTNASTTTTTTIASSASSPDSHATEAAATEGGGEEEEGGSFFDLEFASVPNEEDESDSISESDVEEGGEPNGKQIFTSLVSLDALNDDAAAADAAKSLHHSPVSLLKSATRLRVFALALNKKRLKSDANVVDSPKSTTSSSSSSNFFIEVFTGSRNNSSKSKAPDEEDPAEERKFTKDVVHKYINSKIKPLYFRVSRRYGGDRMRFSGPLTAAGGDAASKKKKKKVMVKSRSAVAAVTSTPPPAPPPAVQRRDDSLLQQEDGIQSAIAHCKKSFNASSKGLLLHSILLNVEIFFFNL
ncbi:putative membrane-associated kinase regulator 2 [Iris pallida]|uniref:Membrane-associated kinase regulator 2 n=1 Tax=Iris pallida TaxID=29817 RepID=A0AAX6DV92_IRIPA|nr:putative membrane-associated kinase regulator 2 [Iris pallida]KAJ6810250.1 putative membrane-associated kinase regulator 2 [Iris pallida]